MTPQELAKIRQAMAKGVVPVTWDKPTVNTAINNVETFLDSSFLAATFVEETVTVNPRAVDVKTRLDSGEVIPVLLAMVEDWLVENRPSITRRSIDEGALVAWLTMNRNQLNTAVSGMPTAQRGKLVRLLTEKRVRAAL